MWLPVKRTGKIAANVRKKFLFFFLSYIKTPKMVSPCPAPWPSKTQASFVSLFITLSEWLLVSWLPHGCVMATIAPTITSLFQVGGIRKEAEMQKGTTPSWVSSLERDFQKAPFSDFWTVISHLSARKDRKCTVSQSYSVPNNIEFRLVRKRGIVCISRLLAVSVRVILLPFYWWGIQTLKVLSKLPQSTAMS